MRATAIVPGVWAVIGAGLVYRAGRRYFAKPIHTVDHDGLWWSPDLGPFTTKGAAVAALSSPGARWRFKG